MKNKKTSCLVLLISLGLFLFPKNSEAQLLDNAKEQNFAQFPNFNEKAIRKNHIGSIRGQFIHYKLGDYPRKTDFFKTFFFDRAGRLIKIKESQSLFKGKDTLVQTYLYGEKGNLIVSKKNNSKGCNVILYSYDNKNRVVHKEYRKKIKYKNKDSVSTSLRKEFTIAFQYSKYKKYDQQLIQTIFNNENRPFKKIFFYFKDSTTRLQRKRVHLLRTSQSKITSYFYNKNNLLDSVRIQSQIGGGRKMLFTFQYDDLGNLVKKDIYKDGEYITQIQIIYNKKTALINDFLVQNVATNFIKILKIEAYTFYSN